MLSHVLRHLIRTEARAIDGCGETLNTQSYTRSPSLATETTTGNSMPKAYWVCVYRDVKDADKLAAQVYEHG